MPSLDDVRAAFAHGWAETDGPMTERVRAACAAHLAWATDHLDDPGLIEATIDTGHLEGVWATIHHRREALHAKHEKAVLKAWAAIVHELPVRDAVTRYRLAVGMHEACTAATDLTESLLHGIEEAGRGETSDLGSFAQYADDAEDNLTEATQGDNDRKNRLKAAAAAAIGWLLAHVRQSRQEAALLEALTEAVREGMAEGATAAVLLAAEQAGASGDPALIYAARLSEAVVPDGTATQVETAILSGATTDATRVLTKPDPAETGAGELVDAVTAELESTDGAAALLTDVAVGRGFSAGMQGIWARLGGRAVDWVTAGDGRVCARCDALEAGSPYPLIGAPSAPAHPRCLIGSTRVTVPNVNVMAADEPHVLTTGHAPLSTTSGGNIGSATAAAMTKARLDSGRRFMNAATEREYIGDVITIRTAFGHELTGTPNHPVATRRGWLPLAELCEGDYVLRSTRPEWELPAIDPDVENIPPCIEDVAQTFPVAFNPMPTAAEDFHGDGAGSDVHVVRADRLLVDHRPTALAQQLCQEQLGGGDVVRGASLDRSSPADLLVNADRPPTSSRVGSLSEARPLFGGGLSHACVHAFAAVTGLDADRYELQEQSVPCDAQLTRESKFALTSFVTCSDFGNVRDRISDSDWGASRPQLNTSRHQSLADEIGADPDHFTDRLKAVAGGVAADQIVDVKWEPFQGHVYNLETVNGYYIGNGILTHNCRCVTIDSDGDWPYTILSGLLGK